MLISIPISEQKRVRPDFLVFISLINMPWVMLNDETIKWLQNLP